MNNWYVLTGGPSSGKTTTIKLLEKKGYVVQHELARAYIDQEMSKGNTLQEIRKNEKVFQDNILRLKIESEKKFRKDTIVFFDRGIPDTVAYYELLHIPRDNILKTALKNSSYKKIFLFESLPYIKDYARTETPEESLLIEQLLEKSYKKLNMPIIKVPVASVEERLQFILDNV